MDKEAVRRWAIYEALTPDNRTAEFIDQSQHDESPLDRLIVWLAQGFGAGKLPGFGGTLASLFGFIWFMVTIAPGNLALYLVAMLLGIRGAISLGRAAERIMSTAQTRTIVVERIAVVPLCFAAWTLRAATVGGHMPGASQLFLGDAWIMTLLVFVAFRLFDLLQPWSIVHWQGAAVGRSRMARAFLAAAASNLVFLLPLEPT